MVVKKKILRRRTFCREEDFVNKIRPQCKQVGYHRWSWEPISIRYISESVTFSILKHGAWDWDEFYSRREKNTYVEYQPLVPEVANVIQARQYLNYLQHNNLLYESKWKHWAWNFENDRIWLRYFSNKPWKPLGVAILERDY